MKIHLALIFGFCSFWCNSFAQSYDTILPLTDTLYFPFYHGIQMIEIDHLSYYERLDLRYSTMDQMPNYGERPFANEYFFRNEEGKIVKSFNSRLEYPEPESKLRPVSFINRSSHLQNRSIFYNSYSTDSQSYFEKKGFYTIFNYKFRDYFDRDTSTLAFGYIDSLGTIIFPAEFNKLIALEKDHILAGKNYKYGIIELDGTVVLPLVYENIDDSRIKEDLIFFGDFHQAYQIAFKPKNKQIITIPPNRYQLTNNIPELFVTSCNGLDGVWSMLTDQQIIPNKYNHITVMDYDTQPNGIAIKVLSGEKYGLFDANGKVILPCVYDEIGEWREENGKRILKVVKNGVATEIR